MADPGQHRGSLGYLAVNAVAHRLKSPASQTNLSCAGKLPGICFAPQPQLSGGMGQLANRPDLRAHKYQRNRKQDNGSADCPA